jgi:hypothetical protein
MFIPVSFFRIQLPHLFLLRSILVSQIRKVVEKLKAIAECDSEKVKQF